MVHLLGDSKPLEIEHRPAVPGEPIEYPHYLYAVPRPRYCGSCFAVSPVGLTETGPVMVERHFPKCEHATYPEDTNGDA